MNRRCSVSIALHFLKVIKNMHTVLEWSKNLVTASQHQVYVYLGQDAWFIWAAVLYIGRY